VCVELDGVQLPWFGDNAPAMGAPFDPLELCTDASLNSTRLAPLPGADASAVGQRADSLLSAHALAQLTASTDRASAAGAYARRLAHLIATLQSGPGQSAEESAWRAAYLRHWSHVQRIWLGGGLAEALGTQLVEDVKHELGRLGRAGVEVDIPTSAATLALLGLARSYAAPRQRRVVLDFGHTTVKRATASYQGQHLERLQVLAPRPAPDPHVAHPMSFIVDFVVDAIADSVHLAHEQSPGPIETLDSHISVSLACYVQKGRPLDRRGTYSPLAGVPVSELEDRLKARSASASAMDVRVSFVHDGTAAARALATDEPAAVIMLGTYLGVGFAPAANSVIPISPAFAITT